MARSAENSVGGVGRDGRGRDELVQRQLSWRLWSRTPSGPGANPVSVRAFIERFIFVSSRATPRFAYPLFRVWDPGALSKIDQLP